MKKLLALILCVMMFVSVIPTMAFAATPDVAAIEAAQKNRDAAKKAADAALATSVKTWTARKNADADVTAIQPQLTAAQTAYDQAKANYVSNPTETTKKALDEAAVKRDSMKSDYDKAVAAYKAAAAAYDADLRAENIANKELAVAEAKLAYAQDPTAAKHADIAVAEADLAAFIAANPAAPAAPAAATGATYDTSKAVAKADPKLKADLENAADYKKQVEKMIANTKKNVATAYGALAMNQVVYASAKSMDDVVGGLVDQIADMLAGKTVNGHKMSSADVKAFKDAHKASVRSVIEDIVISEIKDNEYKYLDKDGKIDPLKYGQVVADAVNAALNNKDFQAGYQAVATYYAMMNVADSINEELKKQRDEFKGSIDSSFDKDFADNYSRLAAEYIDTLTETGGFDADNFPWTAYITPEVGKQS